MLKLRVYLHLENKMTPLYLKISAGLKMIKNIRTHKTVINAIGPN